MKKWMLSIFIGMILIGCAKKTESVSLEKKDVLICASFYPVYVTTMNVVRDVPNLRVVNMASPKTGCLHDYQLTPEDMKLLSKADVFVMNGAGMEEFLEKVLQQFPNLKIIDASQELSFGENPHIWMSTSGVVSQTANIASELAKLFDEKRAEQLRKNADIYRQKIVSLREKMTEVSKSIPESNKNIVIFHESFEHFAKEMGLSITDIIEHEHEHGTNSDAKELSESIQKIKTKNVKAIFSESQYPALSAETISRETGVKIYILDSIVSGPMENPQIYDAYLNAMEKNLKTLEEALK